MVFVFVICEVHSKIKIITKTKMTFRRCEYFGCKNYKKISPSLSFYTFPIKDAARCKTWILNSGNAKLFALSESVLKSKALCEIHFIESSFRDFRASKRLLTKFAVPVKYVADLADSTSSKNKQQHQTPVNTLNDQKPVILNFKQIIQPSAKMAFDGLDETKGGEALANISAPELNEPEIKIECTSIASLTDPLLLTYSNKNKSPPQLAIQQKPKNPTIKELRRISPSRFNNLKCSPTNTKSATATIIEASNSTITTPSNKEADSLLQPKLELPAYVPDTSKPNVQVCNDINEAQSIFKYKIQSTPTLELVATPKPQVSKNIKTETVDLTLEDDNIKSTTNNLNGNNGNKRDLICKICSKKKLVLFFCVPISSKKIDIWRFCVRDPSLKSSDVVCSSHFIKEDYLEVPRKWSSVGKLKPHVVPTPVGNIRHGCAIQTCINRYRNISNMYAVPVWTNYTLWTALIPDLANLDLGEILQYRVCGRHFDSVTEENMFCLKPNQNLSIEHELEQYLEKRRELQTLLGCQNDSACTFTTCVSKLGSEDYKFPEDYDEAHYWLKLCKRSDILKKNKDEIKNYLKSQRLCSEHYNQIKSEASETFKGDSLKTQLSNDQSSDSPTHEQDNIVLQVKTYIPMRVYCAFKNCSSYIKTATRRFRFPLKQKLLKKWQKACGIADFIDLNDFPNLFVCGNHFKESQYTIQGILKRGSVPEFYKDYTDPLATASNFHWTRKCLLTKRKYVPKKNVSQPSADFNNDDLSIDFYNEDPSTDSNNDDSSTDSNNDGPSAGKKIKVETTNSFPDQVLLGKKCCMEHCKSDQKTVLVGFSNVSGLTRQLWIKAIENTADITIEKFDHYSDKFICLNHFEERYRINNDTQLIDTAIPTLGLIDYDGDDDSFIKLEPETSVVWIKSEIDRETNKCLSNDSVRSEPTLYDNSTEFSTMKRELKFGEDCP